MYSAVVMCSTFYIPTSEKPSCLIRIERGMLKYYTEIMNLYISFSSKFLLFWEAFLVIILLAFS